MYILEVVIFLLLVLILFAAMPDEAACAELDVDEYVEKYRASDLKRNDGTGYSTYTNSSSLGWGESAILSDYIDLYRVTEDAYWLQKVTQHFDQMIYGMIGNAARTNFREFTAAEVESMVSERIQIAESCDFTKTDDDGHQMWHVEFPGWYTDRYSVAYAKVTETKSKTA